MHKNVLAALVALATVGSAGTARADTLPLLVDVPASYFPGSSFTFQLHAPGLIGLAGYSITLQVQAGPTSQPLTLSASAPPGLVDDPFPTAANFAALEPTPTVLQISDSTAGPRVTTVGGNDYLALVTVTPAPGDTAPITITVTAATFNRFTLPGEPQFTLPPPVTVQPDVSGGPSPVPAPPAWVMFATGGLGLFARARLRRTTA